jgi:steroid delta-isomerase-like uncharacterized protein
MSAEANKALVRRFFEDVCNGMNLDVADRLFATDHAYHDPVIRAELGPEGIKQVVSPYHPAFSEVRWTVDDMVAAEGDRVVTRWTGSGVHTDDVMGIPPTGKRVTVSGIWIHRIASGKIAESWNIWDAMGMVKQLGAVPVLAHAGG